MIQRKHITITITIFLGICLLYYLFVLYPRQGKVAVDILSSPMSATISINDSPSSVGTTYLPTGTYTLKATEEGWESKEITITISEEVSEIALVLTPISTEAKEQAKKESLTREGLSSIAANVRGFTIRNTYPILNSLPYSDISGPYKLDYGFNQDDKKTPYIIVSFSTPNGRHEAIQWLKENGTDLTRTEIIFEDFTNPTYREKDPHEHQ